MTAKLALTLGLILSLLTLHPQHGWAQNDAASALKNAVDSTTRSAKDRARDQYRHPLETLTFFGLKPDMTVVEIWPGGGWYTDILAPYLHDRGKLYAAAAAGENAAEYKKKLADDPTRFGNVIVTQLDPPDKMAIAPPGSA